MIRNVTTLSLIFTFINDFSHINFRYKLRFGQPNLSLPLKSKGEEVRNIDHVSIHDKFDNPSGSRYYDIAIIKFKKIEFTHNIRPICMFHNEINPYLRTAVALGWGDNDKDGLPKDTLRQRDLTIFDRR